MDTEDALRKARSSNRLDLLVGASAIVIAVISLAVALRQSQIMERQLSASVWPYLQYGTSNGTDDGKSVISFDIENVGIGPAQVHSMSLRYKDQPIHHLRELLKACCEDLMETKGKPSWWISTLHHQVLLPNRRKSFLMLTDVPTNAPYWVRLNTERANVEIQLCYCSVLDQCWIMDSKKDSREAVAACPAPQADDYVD